MRLIGMRIGAQIVAEIFIGIYGGVEIGFGVWRTEEAIFVAEHRPVIYREFDRIPPAGEAA